MSDIYIVSSNGKLSTQNETLRYTDVDGTSRVIFPHLTDRISTFGSVNITSSALFTLMNNKIPVFFMTKNGKMRGRLEFSEGKNVFLRQKQYILLNDHNRRLAIAKSIVKGKLHNQYRYLQRYTDNKEALSDLKHIIKKADRACSLEILRGYEGVGAHIYFANMGCHLPAWLCFSGRNSNPPLDPFNAVLSFLYTLLSSHVEGFVEKDGFDSYVGVLHELSYGRKSLVCDLMEEFRVALGDSIAAALFNRHQLTQDDFEAEENSNVPLRICNSAIPKIIEAFEAKLHKEVMYIPLQREIPYWKIIEQQVSAFKKIVECKSNEYIPVYFR